MDNNGLVDYYCNRFLKYIHLRESAYTNILDVIRELRYSLKRIIDYKRDYILTEPFIENLCYSQAHLLSDLRLLISPDENIFFDEVLSFFIPPFSSCINFKGNINQSNNDYVLHLDDETKKQVIKAYQTCLSIEENYNGLPYDFELILLSMLTKCFLDQNISIFSDMADKLAVNPLSAIEYMKLHGIDYNNTSGNYKKLADLLDRFYNKRSRIIS